MCELTIQHCLLPGVEIRNREIEKSRKKTLYLFGLFDLLDNLLNASDFQRVSEGRKAWSKYFHQ